MSNILKISEAASLALHTAVFLAENPKKLVSTKDIASALQVSEAHLSKVLQRLVKVGLAKSTRGPKGGFMLGKDSDTVSLLDVYEAIEGSLILRDCLFGIRICAGKSCILGGLVETLNKQVKEYLAKTKLSELTSVYRKEENVNTQKYN